MSDELISHFPLPNQQNSAIMSVLYLNDRGIVMDSSETLKIRRVRDLLSWGAEELRKHNIEFPNLDAEVLLSHAMRRERLQLYLVSDEPVDKDLESYYKTLIHKRSASMPISYITGHKEFMSLDFSVNEDVLIPRPETEILVETICKFGKSSEKILELGTGSGAIAVSLAKYNPDWHIIATDLSLKAIRAARQNALHNEVADRIEFLQSDLFGAFSSQDKLGWVVSNPPYISGSEMSCLPDEVRRYEPAMALDGGQDGLDIIRRIIAEAYKFLKSDGKLAMEIGYGQSADIQDIARGIGYYSDCSIVKDYSGIPRILYWSLN